jgi:hypothetical protein
MKRLANNFINAAVKASAFIVAAMVGFSSCEPAEEAADPSVAVSQTEFTSEAAGASFEVTVTSNVAWTAAVENADKWVTVAPAEGEAGETKVTVTVKKNNGDNSRSTKVVFTAETATAQVAVTQFGKDNIAIDKTAYAAPVAGGTDAVKVTTNNNWTATVSEGADWVTVAPASGAAGEADVTVTVAPNATAEARTAKVTFAAGDAKIDYAVSQEGLSIAVSKASYSIDAEGGEDAVTVTANAAWTAESDAEWVVVAPAEGEAGETAVTVTVSENKAEEARTATVTFTVNDDVKVEYAVSQEAKKPVTLVNQYAYTASGAEIVPVDIKSKFIEFAPGYILGYLVPEEGINDGDAVGNCAEFAAFAVAESAIESLMGATSSVDLTTVPAGALRLALYRNENPVFDYTGAEGQITAGTVAFTVGEQIVIDVDMVLANGDSFKANVAFAPEAFVKPVGTVDVAVTNITASKATVTCTPDPAEGFTYYFECYPKEDFDFVAPTDEEKIAFIVNATEEILSDYGLSWADAVSEGVDSYDFAGLDPLTEYYALAFGIDEDGKVTTGLFKTVFTTKDVNPALKQWMGTWEVTSEKTYYQEDGGKDGVLDEPTKRTITIGTKSAGFGIKLAESELIIAGLSYYDGLEIFGPGSHCETVGTVTDKGTLELKNGFELFDATSAKLGMLTWAGYAWSEMLNGYYVVGGNYPPYTFAFGADKTTGTAKPYSGELSNGADFSVVAYDIFIYDVKTGKLLGSLYSAPDYGAPAGTWSLKKVEEEPAAMPSAASIKLMSKVERNMMVENAKVMQNLNSNFLFASAR